MSVDPKDMLALPAEAKLGGPKMPSARPCYSDAGWLQWSHDESWYEASKSAADINRARGDEAHARGGFNARTGNWLRASTVPAFGRTGL